jgi:TonB-dependent starch-binding outer membrane protein SusC
MFKSLLLKGRTLCLLLCCMVSSLVVTAQTKQSGKVIGSDDKLPVVGASVRIKGTNTGAVTDVNGNFSLALSPGNVLVVSYIGFQTKEVNVTSGAFLTILLEPANSTLNEVVVTGYTSQRKKDIAGAVSVVDVGSAKKLPASSSDQLLQGQAAGVTVITQGAPGAPSAVFIRGISNFGNSQPLYVIDGVQGGSMSDVNPNDIESIQVLKDAGAAAIYGVSGGNGVVVITTKRGKAGKSILSYDAYYGDQVPPGGNVYHALDAQGMSTLTWLVDPTTAKVLYPGGSGTVPVYGYQGPGTAGVADGSFDLTKYNFDASNPANDFLIQKFNQGRTDWFHEIFKSAPVQYHTISASGANDKNNYYLSFGYQDQEGTEIDTYQKRYETRINTTFNISNHVRIGENLFMFYKTLPTNGFANQGEGDAISFAYRMDPQIPVYDIKGNYGGTYDGPGGEPLGNSANPVFILSLQNNQHFKDWQINGNGYVEADFLKHFTVKTLFGGNIENQYFQGFITNPYMDYEGHNNANTAAENASYQNSYNWTNTILYKQIFGKHNLSVLGGFELKNFAGRQVGGNGTNLFSVDPNYVNLSNVTKGIQLFSNAFTPTSVMSLFGRLDYIYNDKYILGATIRRDGFSAFAQGRQYGTFPSVSLAWRISQEDFLKSVSWLNDLKLRASYGIAGNNSNVPGDNAFSSYNSGFGNGYYAIGGGNATTQGFYNSNLGNVKTTWETDKTANIGIDATLFNHLDLNLEYYQKKISGLLFRDQAPSTVGAALPPFVNIGDVENKGVDLAATYHGTAGDLRYSAGTNITIYKNNITKIPGNYFDEVGTRVNFVVREEVGHPIGEFYGYKVTGFYSPADMTNAAVAKYAGATVGSFKYADVNGDGVVNDADRTWIGNPNPNFTYGVNLNASYKNFDISVVLYGSQGNKDFHYTKYFTDFYGSFQGGKSIEALHNSYGSPGVTNPTLPIATDNNSMGTTQISSYYVEGGSFLKCRVAQIGYNFSPAILKSVGITKLHVYVQGTNLFTITKYTGLDPELPPNSLNNTNTQGVDLGNYPNNQREYLVGVNMSF